MLSRIDAECIFCVLYLSIRHDIDMCSGRLDVILRGKLCGQGVMLNQLLMEKEKMEEKEEKEEEGGKREKAVCSTRENLKGMVIVYIVFSSRGISKAGIFNLRCKYVGKDASIWSESCDDDSR